MFALNCGKQCIFRPREARPILVVLVSFLFPFFGLKMAKTQKRQKGRQKTRPPPKCYYIPFFSKILHLSIRAPLVHVIVTAKFGPLPHLAPKKLSNSLLGIFLRKSGRADYLNFRVLRAFFLWKPTRRQNSVYLGGWVVGVWNWHWTCNCKQLSEIPAALFCWKKQVTVPLMKNQLEEPWKL